MTAGDSYIRYDINACCLRWGGGTKPGMWHVFFMKEVPWLGFYCVVDDFGDLVQVPS